MMNTQIEHVMNGHATRNTEHGLIISFNNGTGKGAGYGFIGRPNLPDLFVHISQVLGAHEKGRVELFPADEVSFQIGTARNGKPCAQNVRVQVRAANDRGGHRPPLQHVRD